MLLLVAMFAALTFSSCQRWFHRSTPLGTPSTQVADAATRTIRFELGPGAPETDPRRVWFQRLKEEALFHESGDGLQGTSESFPDPETRPKFVFARSDPDTAAGLDFDVPRWKDWLDAAQASGAVRLELRMSETDNAETQLREKLKDLLRLGDSHRFRSQLKLLGPSSGGRTEARKPGRPPLFRLRSEIPTEPFLGMCAFMDKWIRSREAMDGQTPKETRTVDVTCAFTLPDDITDASATHWRLQLLRLPLPWRSRATGAFLGQKAEDLFDQKTLSHLRQTP